MRTRRPLALAALLALIGLVAVPLLAAATEMRAIAMSTAKAVKAPAFCRPTGERIDLAQSSPFDCCKGHKGICGCRAGKIVCCDGSVSKDPNCTCHSDWGETN
ncbi:MAG: hypothetical protein ACUVT2_08565 [Thiobacillaceae bacterium]